MAFDPGKYDLTTEVTAENLIRAREVYVALVEKVKVESESSQSAESKLRKEIFESGSSTRLEEILRDFRNVLWTHMQENPEESVHLFEYLGDVKSDVKTFRDATTDEMVRQLRKSGNLSVDVPADLSERKSEAESVGTFIRSLYNIAVSMDVDLSCETEDSVVVFPTKTLEKSGDVVPDLPRLPNGPSDSDSVRGRGAKNSLMRYKFNGEDIPAGTILPQVMLIASDANHIYSASDLKLKLEESKQDMFDRNGWKIQLATGELQGIYPVVSSEEVTED